MSRDQSRKFQSGISTPSAGRHRSTAGCECSSNRLVTAFQLFLLYQLHLARDLNSMSSHPSSSSTCSTVMSSGDFANYIVNQYSKTPSMSSSRKQISALFSLRTVPDWGTVHENPEYSDVIQKKIATAIPKTTFGRPSYYAKNHLLTMARTGRPSME